MNYWPLSAIKNSPACRHPGFIKELDEVYTTNYLSPAAFSTCGFVARQTIPQSMPNLVVIESVNASARCVYTGRPDWREWMALERGGVIEASDGVLHVLIDALH